MSHLFFSCLTHVLLLTVLLTSCEGLRCVPCGGDGRCPLDPPICINGLVTDICECCMVCGKGEGDVCGGLWNMRGKCGDGLVCVKPQSYPEQASYPEGKCRSHPTKRPLITEDEELGNATSTIEPATTSLSSAPTTTKIVLPTTSTSVTTSTTTTTTESADSSDFSLLNALNYSQWVRRRLQN